LHVLDGLPFILTLSITVELDATRNCLFKVDGLQSLADCGGVKSASLFNAGDHDSSRCPSQCCMVCWGLLEGFLIGSLEILGSPSRKLGNETQIGLPQRSASSIKSIYTMLLEKAVACYTDCEDQSIDVDLAVDKLLEYKMTRLLCGTLQQCINFLGGELGHGLSDILLDIGAVRKFHHPLDLHAEANCNVFGS
jgi:hypothetical protein